MATKLIDDYKYIQDRMAEIERERKVAEAMKANSVTPGTAPTPMQPNGAARRDCMACGGRGSMVRNGTKLLCATCNGLGVIR